MTSSPAGPRFRDQLAEVLMGRWLSYGEDHQVDDLIEHPDRAGARITVTHAGLLADALAPVVEAVAVQRAADELEAAADHYKRQLGTVGAFDIPLTPRGFAGWLRSRAAALRSTTPAPRHEETTDRG